jgi:isoquinoline 1-oxidoreductase beta subunit
MKLERLFAPARPEGASRRQFLVGSAVVGGALVVGCSQADLLSFGAHKSDLGAFGAFVKIAPDGAVTVVSKHIELGQGSHTGLAAIVAEELDADWRRVSVVDAPANAKLYMTAGLGAQGTGGSTAIAESWMQLRKAGAAARAMFVQAASAQWGAPAFEISVKDGVVSHAASGKSATFGQLLEAAAKIAPPADPPLKDPAAFSLIGTERVRRLDSRAKSTGQPLYTQDQHLEGMLTAVVAHSPRFGGKVKRFDAAAAKARPDVIDVFAIPTGVAVVAKNTWAAMKGREALTVEWDNSKAETRSSDEISAAYREIAAGKTDDKWDVFDQHGEIGDLGADAPKFTYDFPYLAHASMEPMNCIAQVEGNRCKLTFASQIPSLDQLNAGLAIGALPGSVEIVTLPAGGSFGRRGTLDSDYAAECVHIAKKIGKNIPVKLVWTREDDMTGGKYRPLAHHAIEVKVGEDGYPAAWKHRIVIQSFSKGTMMGKSGLDETTVEGALGSPYLKVIPAVDGKVATPTSPISVSWWRSVGATHTALAMEHTVEQLARRAGMDSVAYRRVLLAKAGANRHLAALDLAVAKSDWGKPIEKGWARGVAVHESFNTVVANVAEVGMVDGEPRVRRVTVAIDCGFAVAPDQVRAQMEGGLCYGLSSALWGAITIKNGAPEQTNFDAYRVLRMNEAPQIDVFIVPSGAPPTGVGEPGTPVIIPAVANALLALTGKPTASLPLVKS